MRKSRHWIGSTRNKLLNGLTVTVFKEVTMAASETQERYEEAAESKGLVPANLPTTGKEYMSRLQV